MTTLIGPETKRRRSETGTRKTSRHEPSSPGRGQSRLALQLVCPASSRLFNDLKNNDKNINIEIFINIAYLDSA
ncbi:hypothetical protein PUP66_19460 [Pseudomonas chlororaphis]|uniref:hypothetical protein n=1 Tax=Pseudomonas chlororaphis TaxID=587753 RepID=UPI000F558DF1|nr:hypothetical protein [Pseudomonas chlororaphis]WDH45280.1 hypothetical protein PUP66_19460 [Pseudomonas chlororaphis]WDH57126.1 hypothetical protein PUP56_19465 [Pseudomonas chlororaphis]WQE16386.1 hypothetical protein U0007_18275 [Pseudomonas chlororaphis]